MRVFQINGGVFGSTGRIMFGISEAVKAYGGEAVCASPITVTNRNNQPKEPYIKIGTYYSRCLSVLASRLTGLEGCFSWLETKRLISKIKKFNPDVLQLHSIHNSYLNLPMLFKYIKKYRIKTVWTLHDCWSFTGHCPHFDMIGCDNWKKQCEKCPLYKDYPKSFLDNSRYMYSFKRKWFTEVPNLTLVTPSKWLSNLVKDSFLKDYPLKVINNGIDLSEFYPQASEFRKKYSIEEKYILLGVAFGWDSKKGLDVFIELSETLGSEYKIILVGTDDNVDELLPQNVLSIHRTQNRKELAEIYSTANIFVNPTREDTYPTVNMEALACGTPVLTFDTGGSGEIIDETCGSAVDKNNVDALKDEIVRICENTPYSKEDCLKRAMRFDMKERFSDYIDLYRSL